VLAAARDPLMGYVSALAESAPPAAGSQVSGGVLSFGN
jgi:hypothetical protein